MPTEWERPVPVWWAQSPLFPVFCYFLTFGFFCAFGSVMYVAQCTGFSCPGGNYNWGLAMLLQLKWSSEIPSNSSIIFKNLSRYALNILRICICCRQFCVFLFSPSVETSWCFAVSSIMFWYFNWIAFTSVPEERTSSSYKIIYLRRSIPAASYYY